MYREVTIAAPAVGVNNPSVACSDEYAELISVNVALTTNAVATNRVVMIQIDRTNDHSSGSGISSLSYYMMGTSSILQVASTTAHYHFQSRWPGPTFSKAGAAGQSDVWVALPPIIIPPKAILTVCGLGFQVGAGGDAFGEVDLMFYSRSNPGLSSG